MAWKKGVDAKKFLETGTAKKMFETYDVIKTRIMWWYFIGGFKFQDMMEVGDELILEREAGNKKDLMAVAIYYKSKKVWYLPKELSGDINVNGRIAKVCSKRNNDNFWRRLSSDRKWAGIYLIKL